MVNHQVSVLQISHLQRRWLREVFLFGWVMRLPMQWVLGAGRRRELFLLQSDYSLIQVFATSEGMVVEPCGSCLSGLNHPGLM